MGVYIYYKPGGFNSGTRPKMPSTSTGRFIACFNSSGVFVFPFHVLNQGPPPTSTAAMVLVTSRITYEEKEKNQKSPQKLYKENLGLIYIYIYRVNSVTKACTTLGSKAQRKVFGWWGTHISLTAI